MDEHNDGEEERTSLICFHGVLPPGEVNILLVLPRRLQLLLMLQNDKIIKRCYSRRATVRDAQQSTAFGWPSSSLVVDREGGTSFSCRTPEGFGETFG